MKNKHLIFLSLLLNLNFIWAQDDENFRSVISLNTDNDALVAWENRDRYYTFGIGLSASFRAKKLLGFQNWFKNKEDYFFSGTLRIEGYTPTIKVVTLPELEGESLVEFDRPFAGILFGNLETAYAFERSFFRTGILLGVIGPSSGAGRLQRWIHDNVTDDDVFDGWTLQVPDQLALNASAEYFYDFTPHWKSIDLYGGARARFGNVYIDASPVLGMRLGRFNKLSNSVSFGNSLLQSKSDWELYYRGNFWATLAGYNATAQGNIFGPKFQYAVDELNPLYLAMSHGLYMIYRRVSVAFDHFFTFGEVVESQRHIYARIELKYRF